MKRPKCPIWKGLHEQYRRMERIDVRQAKDDDDKRRAKRKVLRIQWYTKPNGAIGFRKEWRTL